MQRCLVPPESLEGAACRLPPTVSRHLRTVLRARPGDALQLLDGAGRRRQVRIAALGRETVECEACGSVETLPPPTAAITLFQCVAKGARMDWLVEKAVELGAARLVPVMSHRCVVRLPEGERVDRWDRLADSALEQCGGAWRMGIDPVRGWADAVAEVVRSRPVFVASLAPGARSVAEALAGWPGTSGNAAAAWFVGPEGDFEDGELRALLDAGAIPVNLGPRILRTETAAIFGLCALLSRVP